MACEWRLIALLYDFYGPVRVSGQIILLFLPAILEVFPKNRTFEAQLTIRSPLALIFVAYGQKLGRNGALCATSPNYDDLLDDYS